MKLVYTKVTTDIETGRLLELEAIIDYSGPWAEAKGDNTDKTAENAQLAFSQQLMSIFSQQFGKQNELFQFLKGKLEPTIDNPTGYGKDALAAMRTGATENITTQYDNAQRAIQGNQFATSRDLPSGVNDMQFGMLKGQEAGAISGAQNQITLADQNLKQQNYWAAINALNGQEAMLNPAAYAGAANQGFNNVGNLSYAYTNSQQSGLMGLAGGAIGGLFQAAGNTKGGFGALFCWIAAELYGGWDTAATRLVRMYLGELAEQHIRWAFFLVGYRVVGKPAAWLVRHSNLARKLAHKVFDPILEGACRSGS